MPLPGVNAVYSAPQKKGEEKKVQEKKEGAEVRRRGGRRIGREMIGAGWGTGVTYSALGGGSLCDSQGQGNEQSRAKQSTAFHSYISVKTEGGRGKNLNISQKHKTC